MRFYLERGAVTAEMDQAQQRPLNAGRCPRCRRRTGTPQIVVVAPLQVGPPAGSIVV